MPHQCTNCGRTFADGSTEMLSGCPDCGGNKFQYQPRNGSPPSAQTESQRSGTIDHTPRNDRPLETSSGEETPSDDGEDDAQRSARSDVVTPGDLPSSHDSPTDSEQPAPSGRVSEPADADPDPIQDPDLASLRAELNDQFESIRIVNPGQYELNLMELYDRQEYIISLREDGRYVIEMPDAWDAIEEA